MGLKFTITNDKSRKIWCPKRAHHRMKWGVKKRKAGEAKDGEID